MGNLIGQARMQYYPTPAHIVSHIASQFRTSATDQKAIVLDPCCGEGEALSILKDELDGEIAAFGVEIEDERYEKSVSIADRLLHADGVNEVTAVGPFAGLLFLNPPYETDDLTGSRMEYLFLQKYMRNLMLNGILVFIISGDYLSEKRIENAIACYFTDLEIYRFPDPDYEAWKQIVIIGRKTRFSEKKRDRNLAILKEARLELALGNLPTIHDMPMERPLLLESNGRDPETVVFVSNHLEPDTILGLTSRNLQNLLRRWKPPSNGKTVRPILPVRQGHMAAMMAAGFFDGGFRDKNGNWQVVKGTTEKVRVEVSKDEENKMRKSGRVKETTTVYREKASIKIRVLDMKTGAVTDLE